MIILINMALASLDEPEKVTMMDAIDYLQKYGYVRHSSLLENASNNSVIKDTQTIIKRGIAEFQETAGLPKTGDLDNKTKEMFTAPRCAVSDAQSEFDMKWEKNDLVYTILNYSPDLTRDEIREAIDAAFAKWSAVIPLNFKEADQDGDHIDIRIGFYRKRHGDNDPFDGEGGALAHAHWPPSGDIHFDDDEKWAYKNEEKILLKKNNKYVYRDLLQTATHEIGHTIGLDHVRRNDSIMKTFYVVSTDSNGRYIEPQLFQFDIEKIQRRYADWTYYEKANKCLRLSSNSGFFNDIDSYCKSNGATLVTIHSADENNFLADFIKKALSSSSSSSVWIGLVDPDKDAFFTWTDDSDFDFLDWQPNQPDNVDGNQHNVIFGPLVKGQNEFGHW
uniref:C-type lectin domain-containing protein n=1 Tax=Acrobeloides nanus TaxID=290746 RepID=A0A914E3I2_9BILA